MYTEKANSYSLQRRHGCLRCNCTVLPDPESKHYAKRQKELDHSDGRQCLVGYINLLKSVLTFISELLRPL